MYIKSLIEVVNMWLVLRYVVFKFLFKLIIWVFCFFFKDLFVLFFFFNFKLIWEYVIMKLCKKEFIGRKYFFKRVCIFKELICGLFEKWLLLVFSIECYIKCLFYIKNFFKIIVISLNKIMKDMEMIYGVFIVVSF